MISVEPHLGEQQAHIIRQMIASLDEAYWRDRSRHKPNLGLNAEVGYYFSCGRESFPEVIRLAVDAIEPIIPGYECEDWVTEPPSVGVCLRILIMKGIWQSHSCVCKVIAVSFVGTKTMILISPDPFWINQVSLFALIKWT